MDRNQLLAFYYTITLGSTGHAADKVGVTGSTISKLLKSLEKEVGHQILTKKGKYLVLTDKGKIFFDTAKNILDEYDLSLRRMQRLSDRMEGAFTLSLPSFISSLWFMEAVTPLLKDTPELSFAIKTLKEAPDFTAGEVDIDIRNANPLFLKKDEIIAQYLTTYNLGLYASQAYIEAKGMPQNAHELEGHTLITFTDEGLFPHIYESQPIKCKQHLIIDCPLSVAHAVENGLGIGPLLLPVVHQSPHPLVPVLPNQLKQTLQIYYTYPATLKHNQIIQELYNYLRSLPEDFLKGRTHLMAKRPQPFNLSPDL